MELTTPGAGTYWYLPPECFPAAAGAAAPRISNKVDVWSAGVIFFKMLYGRLPLGDGMSQEAIANSGTIARATAGDLVAPAMTKEGTKVSEGARRFLARALTPNQADRPDVLQICEDPYLRAKLK